MLVSAIKVSANASRLGMRIDFAALDPVLEDGRELLDAGRRSPADQGLGLRACSSE